ncbi:uncharacterized protein LOC106088043 [Stomoxys calcitrans]|uniref:uncharacterized protein LOC106088043 n=1 Tax=Stomoxys calcitrans TaxID=35570 RepID=UPI0027E277EE|nr:uncharacterized protein LOC106088043 [Stomoxys calcitrans]
MAVKSRVSDKLELSEFFDNEDSDGYRLAEFLQKRRGRVPRQNYLFMNCEPLRLSLDVQFEKAPQKQNINTAESGKTPAPLQDEQNENLGPTNCSAEIDARQRHSPTANAREGDSADRASPSSPLNQLKKISPRRLGVVRRSGGISPGDRLRRYSFKCASRLSAGHRRTLLHEFDSTVSDSAFNPNVCSTPLSQEAKVTGETNGDENIVASPTPDKENSTQNEKTCCSRIETFDKCVHSKDENLREMLEATQKMLEATQQMSKDNLPCSPARSKTSSARRTYTIEKGDKPGQVILTPESLGVSNRKRLTRDKSLDGISLAAGSSRALRRPAILSKLGNVSMDISKCSRLHSTRQNSVFYDLQNENDSAMDITLTGTNNHSAEIRSQSLSPHRNWAQAKRQTNTSVMNITLGANNALSPDHVRSVSFQNEKLPSRNQSQITIRLENPQMQNTETNKTLAHNVSGNLTIETCRTLNNSRRSEPPTMLCGEIPVTQYDDEIFVPETQDVNATSDKIISIQGGKSVVVIPVNQTFHNASSAEANNSSKLTNNTKEICTASRPAVAVSGGAGNVQPSKGYSDEADNLKLTDILTDDEEPSASAATIRSTGNNTQSPLNLAAYSHRGRTKRLRKRSLSRRRLDMDRSQALTTETEIEEMAPLALNDQTAKRKRVLRKNQLPLNKPPGIPLNGEKFALELARMSNYEIIDLRKRNSMGRVFAVNGRKSLRSKEQAIKKQMQLSDEIEQELLRRNTEPTRSDDDMQTSDATNNVGIELYPPVPDEFRDALPIPMGNLSDSLAHEKSSDRVSFRTRKSGQKKKDRSTKQIPETLQHYLEVSQKYRQKKTDSLSGKKSKPRPLYSRGLSDTEDNAFDNTQGRSDKSDKSHLPIPYVPSPPKSTSFMSPEIVPPPSPFVASQSVGQQLRNSEVDSDSGIDTNAINGGINASVANAVPSESGVTIDDGFKKPLQPAPKNRGRKRNDATKSNVASRSEEGSNAESSETTDGANSSDTLRRSKREPKKTPVPMFQVMFQQLLTKSLRASEARITKSKNSSAVNGGKSTSRGRKKKPLEAISEDKDLGHIAKASKKKTREKNKNKGSQESSDKRTTQDEESLECSRIKLPNPPPLDHFNNIFDHLRNTSIELPSDKENKQDNKDQTKMKKLKIRVARVKQKVADNRNLKPGLTPLTSQRTEPKSPAMSNISQTPMASSSVSSSADTNTSNFELLSWLKNITETESVPRKDEIFKEMRISSASSLCFCELQGIEYAFYDTDEKASLGYLRFKPKQIKPRKRAKKYHLHFITLVGNFRITANDKERQVGPGDMVAIEKSVYYDIENLCDDVGILMVVKK